jgi:hypothetical protein
VSGGPNRLRRVFYEVKERAMKAGTVSLGLWHLEPGHHKEVCQWHDADHKPEVLGTTPHVFISQRWVASPAMVDKRSAARLPHGGGEYVNLYWTTGTPDELGRDFEALGARLTAVGRMEPNKYITSAWRTRTRPVSLQARNGLVQSPEAVPAAPVNTGLMIVILELRDTPERDAYARWHETEHIPMILNTGLFTGAVKVMGSDPDRQNHLAMLFYTDVDDTQSAYLELQQMLADWRKTGRAFPDADNVRTLLHSSMYCNSIGQYDFYD